MTLRIVALLAYYLVIVQCSSKKESRLNFETSVEILYHPDSTLKAIVEKRNGKSNGKAIVFNENGTKLWEHNYVDDVQEGLQYTYDGYGRLIWVENYVNGKLNGWAKCYAGPCGLLSQEGQYVDDQMKGLWYEYYGRELLEIRLYTNDSTQSLVYRNQKYPDNSILLSPTTIDCGWPQPK